MNKQELIHGATPVFKSHPNQKVVFATTDGQYFLNKAEADLHASTSSVEVVEIAAKEAKVVEQPSPVNPA